MKVFLLCVACEQQTDENSVRQHAVHHHHFPTLKYVCILFYLYFFLPSFIKHISA